MTRQPDPHELSQAAFLLRLSARPVILAGGGVAAAGAEEELARIAGKIDAPVITTWNGKGTISDRNEFSAGCIFGLPAATPGLEAADTVFALGTTFEAGADFNLPAQMIQIDLDPDQLGRRYPVRLGVAGDAKAALGGILEALEAPNPLKGVLDRASVAPADRTAPGRAAQLRTAALRRARARGEERIAALEAIRSALPDNTTILHRDGGSAPWFFHFFEVAEAGTWLAPGPDTDFPIAEAAAAAGAAAGPVVTFCEEAELIPHLRELEGLEEPGDLTFVVFTDRGDEDAESALSEAAGETGLRIVVTSGVDELAAALRRAAGTPNHSIIESDLAWSPSPA